MNEPRSLVLAPDVSYETLAEHLRASGWIERPMTTVTPPILPGEPELVHWVRESDDTMLTTTMNPVVRMRVLRLTGTATAEHLDALERDLPTMNTDDMARAFESDDVREVLRGILAAAEVEALELAGPIGLLAAHAEPTVAETAARVHLDLLHIQATTLAATDRMAELSGTLQAIGGNAMPLLAALVGASPDEVLGLQPTEEDCDEAFVEDVARDVFSEYGALWTDPPRVEPGPDRQSLDVHACPAELFAAANPFSRAFPGGYGHIAPYLRRGRVWLAWRYCRPGATSGLAMDGLVHVRGEWVWFPKAYRVVGRILEKRRH